MLSLQATISLDAAAPSTRADALSLIRWDVHVDWHERHECVSSSCSLSSSSAPTLTRLVQVPQVGDPARDHADRRRCVRPLFLIPPASCTPRLTRPLSQHVREPVRLLPALDAPQHDVAARAVRGVRCACLSLSLSLSLPSPSPSSTETRTSCTQGTASPTSPSSGTALRSSTTASTATRARGAPCGSHSFARRLSPTPSRTRARTSSPSPVRPPVSRSRRQRVVRG